MAEKSLYLRRVPEETIRKAKILAAIEGKRLGDVVASALNTYIQELEKQGRIPFGVKAQKRKARES